MVGQANYIDPTYFFFFFFFFFFWFPDTLSQTPVERIHRRRTFRYRCGRACPADAGGQCVIGDWVAGDRITLVKNHALFPLRRGRRVLIRWSTSFTPTRIHGHQHAALRPMQPAGPSVSSKSRDRISCGRWETGQLDPRRNSPVLRWMMEQVLSGIPRGNGDGGFSSYTGGEAGPLSATGFTPGHRHVPT